MVLFLCLIMVRVMATPGTLDTTREHTHTMAWHRKCTPSSTEITWSFTSVCITLHTWQTGLRDWDDVQMIQVKQLVQGQKVETSAVCTELETRLVRKYLRVIVRWTAHPLCARTQRDSRHICGCTRNGPSQRFPLETPREAPRFSRHDSEWRRVSFLQMYLQNCPWSI